MSGIKDINIAETFSFRGRRKLASTCLDETEKANKQRKVNLIQEENSSESNVKICRKLKNDNVNERSNQDLRIVEKLETNVEATTPKSDTKTKNINKKSVKSKVQQEEPEIDIEDCELQLIEGKSKVDKLVKWMPDNWEEVLRNIREQTTLEDDVDCNNSMNEDTPPKVKRYQDLVSLMLSSRTKDEITDATMLKLREHGLTVDNILNTDETHLGELIRKVSFWRTKAKHIKKTTQILKDEYDSDIPNTVEKMLQLPGVGPKMANLCMTISWGKIHGIGVDTHVHRISNRLQWVQKPTNTPEQTRIALESWLPQKLWYEISNLIGGFGQQICLARNPKCIGCYNNKLCSFGRKELKGKRGKD